MIRLKTGLTSVLVGCIAASLAGATHALPALQLGPTGYPPEPPGWTYNTSTQTWDYIGGALSTVQLSAYANATGDDGGNGAYAWNVEETPQYAYLVVASVPDLGSGSGDNFNITVTGATSVTSGYGAAPLEDPNDLAPHSIFSTYFEIYQFQFNGSPGTITNTQPPYINDTGAGYAEDFSITINSLLSGVTGLHFDVFTTTGAGASESWLGEGENKQLVYAFAPFSHDAQWNPAPPGGDPNPAPAPGTVLLMGLGLFGIVWVRRRSSTV